MQLLRCNLLLIIVYSFIKNLGIYVGLYVSHTFFKKRQLGSYFFIRLEVNMFVSFYMYLFLIVFNACVAFSVLHHN